jgi:hypothetical protein
MMSRSLESIHQSSPGNVIGSPTLDPATGLDDGLFVPTSNDASTALANDLFIPTSHVNPDLDSHLHGGFQMLFDSSNDVQGLSEELDWLFGTISPDQGGSYDLYANPGEVANLPSFSPSSTNSHQSLTETLSTSDSLWLEVREKTMLALQPSSPDLLDSSFFEAVNLQKFFQIYFNDYNTHFPILHQPTFSCREASPLLLLAILTLGATLSEREHFETAQAIHDRLRWLIFSVSTLSRA